MVRGAFSLSPGYSSTKQAHGLFHRHTVVVRLCRVKWQKRFVRRACVLSSHVNFIIMFFIRVPLSNALATTYSSFSEDDRCVFPFNWRVRRHSISTQHPLFVQTFVIFVYRNTVVSWWGDILLGKNGCCYRLSTGIVNVLKILQIFRWNENTDDVDLWCERK